MGTTLSKLLAKGKEKVKMDDKDFHFVVDVAIEATSSREERGLTEEERFEQRELAGNVLQGNQIDVTVSRDLSQPVQPATEEPQFTVFPKLPLELRLMIWREAMPHSRIVEIAHSVPQYKGRVRNDEGKTAASRFYDDPKNWAIIANTKPPAVLSVCHESRTEALKKYTVKLHTSENPGEVMIDPYNDMVYIPTFGGQYRSDQRYLIRGSCIDIHVMASIKHLAIDVGLWWSTFYDLPSRASRQEASYPLTVFPSLEDLTLVFHDEYCALEAYTHHQDHEVRFAETSLEIFIRNSSYGRAIDYLVSLIAKYKSQNPESNAPKLRAVIAGLGERMCCMHKHLEAYAERKVKTEPEQVARILSAAEQVFPGYSDTAELKYCFLLDRIE